MMDGSIKKISLIIIAITKAKTNVKNCAGKPEQTDKRFFHGIKP